MQFRRGVLRRCIPQQLCCTKAGARGAEALGFVLGGASAAEHAACKDASTSWAAASQVLHTTGVRRAQLHRMKVVVCGVFTTKPFGGHVVNLY